MITLEQLIAVFNKTPRALLSAIHPHLVAAMDEFGVNTVDEVCMFLARAGEESAGLGVLSENLNYSSEGLRKHFSKYFPDDLSTAYARQPVRIANRVYANRMGNGPESSGDGWRTRGAGIFQVTGTNNQLAVAKHFNIPPAEIGDWLRSPVGACRSAGYFWKENGCNELADARDFVGVTRRVNGGTNGMDDRMAYLGRAQRVIV